MRPVDVGQAKEHSPAAVRRRDVYVAVHGNHHVGQFNARVAVAISRAVGSMWCAYAVALCSVPLVALALKTGDALTVAWFSVGAIDLALLPILLVGQNVEAAAHDARAEADHLTLTALHRLTANVHEINELQTKILEQQSEILARLDAGA